MSEMTQSQLIRARNDFFHFLLINNKSKEEYIKRFEEDFKVKKEDFLSISVNGISGYDLLKQRDKNESRRTNNEIKG